MAHATSKNTGGGTPRRFESQPSPRSAVGGPRTASGGHGPSITLPLLPPEKLLEREASFVVYGADPPATPRNALRNPPAVSANIFLDRCVRRARRGTGGGECRWGTRQNPKTGSTNFDIFSLNSSPPVWAPSPPRSLCPLHQTRAPWVDRATARGRRPRGWGEGGEEKGIPPVSFCLRSVLFWYPPAAALC